MKVPKPMKIVSNRKDLPVSKKRHKSLVINSFQRQTSWKFLASPAPGCASLPEHS